MNYTDQQLDEGVAIAGGGYTISWGDLEATYWNPPTDRKYYEILYVIEWDSANTINRLSVERLPSYIRNERYIESAVSAVESYLGEEMIIGEILLIPVGGTIGVNTYVVTIGGETALDTDLLLAKWKVIGAWARNNIKEVSSASYLKLEKDNVFLIDENTFLIL
jgi:hypothetical protein